MSGNQPLSENEYSLIIGTSRFQICMSESIAAAYPEATWRHARTPEAPERIIQGHLFKEKPDGDHLITTHPLEVRIMRHRIICYSFTGLLLTFFLSFPAHGGENMAFSITSPAFGNGEGIPSKYTCEGEDVSPALRFAGAPDGTKSLALIVDDPDAPDPADPKMIWVHWVLYNLPPDATGLKESVASLPAGTLEGLNDWKRTGYGGPCPPIGRHRYFFKLYALDTILPDLHEPTRVKLKQAMQGHILEKMELTGSYQKR